jgi:hypothetical protein
MYAETAGVLDRLSRGNQEVQPLGLQNRLPSNTGVKPRIPWELYSACIRGASIAILYE